MSSYIPGLVHDDLKVFLVNNIPVGKKKSKVTLGVGDPKLGATIQETLNIQCTSGQLHLSLSLFINQSVKSYLSHRGHCR